MQSIAAELEEKTRRYWEMSKSWNNRMPSVIPTGDALEYCSHLMHNTSQSRPIVFLAKKLQGEIINGEGSIREAPAMIHILKATANV